MFNKYDLIIALGSINHYGSTKAKKYTFLSDGVFLMGQLLYMFDYFNFNSDLEGN